MEEKIFEGLTYLISYPKGFDEDKKHPLVILLHFEPSDFFGYSCCFPV